jgi:hypothetical protein
LGERPTFEPAFVKLMPGELASEMRENGTESWPMVARLLQIS